MLMVNPRPVNQQPLFWTFTSPGYPVNASYPATSTVSLPYGSNAVPTLTSKISFPCNWKQGHHIVSP